jgi:hypothetical protein
MKTPREDRGMLSRLPHDKEYWDEFTNRIVADAGPHLVARRDDRGEWWSAMARFSTLLATGAVAALLALVSLLPAPQANAGRVSPDVQVVDPFGMAPVDPLATPLLAANSPPTMDALIWSTPENQP